MQPDAGSGGKCCQIPQDFPGPLNGNVSKRLGLSPGFVKAHCAVEKKTNESSNKNKIKKIRDWLFRCFDSRKKKKGLKQSSESGKQKGDSGGRTPGDRSKCVSSGW